MPGYGCGEGCKGPVKGGAGVEYYLSVDGGGTKTAFLLQSVDGRQEYSLTDGASSVKSVGEQAARDNLARGLARLWQESGAAQEQVRYAVFGLSGCDSGADEARLHKILQGLGWQPGRYTLCNDALLAFYAAAEPPGLVLIAGTGSIVLGVDAAGRQIRAGGWGYGFSDLGSGQWLGTRALELALRGCDGCRSCLPWFETVARQLGAADLKSLPDAAASLQGQDQVAALAPVLLNVEKPDETMESVLEEGAGYLAELVQAGWNKLALPPEQPFRLVFAGGCMKNEGYARRVLRRLPPRLQAAMVAPRADHSPVRGGIRLAQTKGGTI